VAFDQERVCAAVNVQTDKQARVALCSCRSELAQQEVSKKDTKIPSAPSAAGWLPGHSCTPE